MKKTEIRNLIKIKRLIKTYYSLEYGELIDYPNDLLPLFTIKKRLHPHNNYPVYISRRSLKHFVERRKTELKKTLDEPASLSIIFYMLDAIFETITAFDFYEFEKYFKHFYTKQSSMSDKSELRVLLEQIDNRLEIISIHFRRK